MINQNDAAKILFLTRLKISCQRQDIGRERRRLNEFYSEKEKYVIWWQPEQLLINVLRKSMVTFVLHVKA